LEISSLFDTFFFFKDFFVFSSINPLEKGIIEGDNPVYDLKKKSVDFFSKVLIFPRVGLFEIAAQSWMVNSI